MAQERDANREAEQLITERDVASLAQKLEEWGNRLAPAEQALLTLIIARAKSTESEEAEGLSTPTVGLSAAQTRSWLTPWALNRNLSYAAAVTSGADARAFAKDTGPSWVDSPRRAARFDRTIIR